MTVSNADFVTAIAKLNELTRQRLMKWQSTQPIRLADSVGSAYETAYQGRRLRIVEYTPPRVRGFFQSPHSQERVYGAAPPKDVVLEIVDDQGQIIFEFPKVQGITDLFDTIKLQLSDVEDFIKSLITAR